MNKKDVIMTVKTILNRYKNTDDFSVVEYPPDKVISIRKVDKEKT